MQLTGRDYDKDFDLEPTEWRKSDAPEPFWGFNAKVVGQLFLLGFVVNAVASTVVHGELPLLLRWLLE